MKKLICIALVTLLSACNDSGSPTTTSASVPPPETFVKDAGIFKQPIHYAASTTPSRNAITVQAKIATASKTSTSKLLPVFNASTAILTIPNVKANDTMYGESLLRYEGSGMFSLANAPITDAATMSASSYANGNLTIKSVMVDDHRYTNAVLHLENDGRFKLVSIDDPILVQKTSYLNAKNLNIPPQDVPKLEGSGGFSEYFTGGVAFGDFFQDGSISMVGFSNRYPFSTSVNIGPEQGFIYFYKKVNGVWVDKTKDLLSDTAGCVTPRKLLVADFNGDGIPDIYAACHGSEFGPTATWPGEHQRIILSQIDGTYKNIRLDLNCYCHTATAADLNNDGTIDILTSDILSANAGKQANMVLFNDGQGNFTIKTPSINTAANLEVVNNTNYFMSYFDMELVDINGDGKLDLFLSGSEMYHNSYILAGDGNGNFDTVLKKFDKTANDIHVTDIVFINGTLYEHLYVNNTKRVQVRKYSKDMSTYELVFDEDTSDFVWIMPYGSTIVPYDSTYGVTIKQ